MKRNTTYVLVMVGVLVVAFSGGAVTYAQMSDTETANVSAQLAKCDVQLDSVTAPSSVESGDPANIDVKITNEGQLGNCPAEAMLNATGTTTGKVDIAFLVDKSGSTEPYIDQIAGQLGDFATSLDNQGIDAEYGVVSYGRSGAVDLDQGYTDSASTTTATLNGLTSDGGTERNYRAIEVALNQLNPRPDAKTFLIDVTDEDTDRNCFLGFCSDPDQTEIANQIDGAGATFIAVSPEQDELRNPEFGDPRPSQDIRVLAQDEVDNGFWVNLFTDDENDNPNNLNDFADEFQDIVIDQSTKTFDKDQSVTLSGGETRTIEFTIDTTGLTPTTPLNYDVTAAGDTEGGAITITAPTSTQTFGISSVDSSSTNSKRIVPNIVDNSTEDAPNGTDTVEASGNETPPTGNETSPPPENETPTETPTTEPTQTTNTTPTTTVTETTDKPSSTPTENETETPTETTVEIPSTSTENGTETPDNGTQTPTPTETPTPTPTETPTPTPTTESTETSNTTSATNETESQS